MEHEKEKGKKIIFSSETRPTLVNVENKHAVHDTITGPSWLSTATPAQKVENLNLNLNLPILGNVERPLEQEVGVVVVVEELGHGVVVAAGQHAGGGFFGVDCGRGRISNFLEGEGRGERGERENDSHFFSYVGLPVVLGAKLPYTWG